MSEQEQVDAWNGDNQTGVIVDVRRDNGDVLRTRTRSSAQMLSGHSAVIWVKGIAGCYKLDRVTRVPFVSDEDFEYERAGGGCVCEDCGKTYRDHPDDLDHPSYDGMPGLVRLCDGRLVKL